jgi:magnesium chelatase subunit I
VRHTFSGLFPDPVKARKRKDRPDPYAAIVAHFDEATCELTTDLSDKEHARALKAVPGLLDLVTDHHAYLDEEEKFLWAEFVLHGLAEHSRIGRNTLSGKVSFSDLFNTMLGQDGGPSEEADDERR